MNLARRAVIAAALVLASSGVAVGTAATANATTYGTCFPSEEGHSKYVWVRKPDGKWGYVWATCRNGWWRDW
ncbi:hypothetical protein [Actinomadura macrotermitis]|uniref:Secreted protein n=1 Tax=Actinomadura macrotermitis TaxID=2585200 RepID=A0A7K0C3E5_9ACTN|nr:hypothetical protein [Actinomadura macrotermitis]MQY07960.1 hypothetical protein [Actinomadura macrotermitis]